jgi:3-dehydroquinate synthase
MRKTFRRLHQPEDPYPVLFGRGLLEQAGALAKGLWGGRRIAVVTHRKLAELYGKTLCARLKAAGADTHLFHIPEGEGSKNLETVRHLYGRLVQYHFGREDGLIALGGGVVGDTAGFVAATYLRGIGLIQIPTSLLAQIDSAIGAKVGVNLPQGKNLIGAFHRPAAVWIDPNVLTTLPPRELRSGLFEMLKYGFIRSPALFRQMERSHDVFRPKTPVLEKAIALAVRAKLAVVREDERETGSRRILNFGHTIGHGLEAAGAYHNLSHGEAVGWGMIAAVGLAKRAHRHQACGKDGKSRANRRSPTQPRAPRDPSDHARHRPGQEDRHEGIPIRAPGCGGPSHGGRRISSEGDPLGRSQPHPSSVTSCHSRVMTDV